ncbi:MAG TPA: ABC transporter permease [Candidatus Limiplasma stercoravium]|nr:ABC transporter permease [Candidatus Limiplasma stercoravium]
MNDILVFVQKAIAQSVPLLYGANGEILTQKSGNLNLGVPGMMYMGGIAGLMGAFYYERAAAVPSPVAGMLIALLCALLASGLGALIYSLLTITLRADQNVTGLALTTFGMGFGNFFGGSLSQLAGGVGQISTAVTASAFRAKIPWLCDLPVVGSVLFSHGFLTYFALISAVLLNAFLYHTRKGLSLRSVGENPATADAAGVNVTLSKYLATVVGGMFAGLGGLFFVMEYTGGTWVNNGFGDRGWLAIALVIFARWRPLNAVWGSVLFGGLYILYLYIHGLDRSMQEIFKALPYLVTLAVLVLTSLRKKREDQPPAGLGRPYFREER